jgi:hypothetical protein
MLHVTTVFREEIKPLFPQNLMLSMVCEFFIERFDFLELSIYFMQTYLSYLLFKMSNWLDS